MSDRVRSSFDSDLSINRIREVVRRRRYLSVAAGAGSTGLAGCLSASGSDVQLAGLHGVNYADEPKTLDVRVLVDGSGHHAERLELDAAEGETADRATVECGWPERGRFVVEASDGEEELAVDVADGDENCLVGAVTIGFVPELGGPLSWYAEPCDEIDDADLFCEFVDG